MTKKETTVIYKSYFEMMELLLTNDSDWREAMTGLLRYGFDGEIPDSDNPLIKAVYVAALPTLKTAAERYEKAVENGKKGGKPTNIKDEDILKLKAEGKKNKEIANLYGVTEKAIEKRFTQIRKNNPTNPTNLNVNVYDNLNDNLSVYENGNANAKETEEENANAKKEKDRVLEDLTDKELNNLLKRYRTKESYTNLQKDFHLAYGTLSKELPSKIDSILKERHKEEIEAKRDEEINRVLAQSAAFSDIDYDERFKMAQANRKKEEEKKKKEEEKKMRNIFKEEKADWMLMLEQEMDCTFDGLQ